jgi:iron-sulfur cluster assembly protein
VNSLTNIYIYIFTLGLQNHTINIINKGNQMTVCTLTSAAQEQITKLCEENNCYAISLNLKGGGCAGFEYEWGIVASKDNLDPNDTVIESESGGRFVIGATSLMFLIGTEVDYVRNLVGSNFEIRNPNTRSSCGCGISVNFDMDTIPHFIG